MQMKPALWTLCTLLTATSPHALGQEPATEYYYGIEANGVLCGYAKIEVSPLLLDGRQLTLLKHEVVTQSSALGNQVDSRIRLTYHLDPLTGRFTYHDSAIEQGSTRLGSAIRIEGDTARCTSTLSDQETLVALPKDAILENTVFFPHLKTDFAERGLETKMYSIFEVRGFQMQDVTYSRVGRETVELAGAQYDAIVLTRLSKQTGLKTKHWIDTRSGLLLKAVQQGNRTSYLADASIVDRIERAEITGTLIAKVGVAIPNFMTLHHMKVNATMEPSGLQVTPESLNLPGQRFTGAVRENLIEGIFEIEPPRYDGTNAPAFPAGAGPDESLAPYLKAEGLIQSDDSLLAFKAHEITAGAQNSWEAACRLSRWVAENIEYAIPGGTTARKTYDTRTGECGSHSFLLAAFCRAVGIPARVVWGCMYIPNFGGAFGQHAWNEIHMGAAGWIPVDATAREIDYIDAGHIRVGVYQSIVTALNPTRMEVLDYDLDSTAAPEIAESAAAQIAPRTGQYTNADNGNHVSVREQDGTLVLDIPDKVTLAFNTPNPSGAWICTMTDRLFLTFEAGTSGGREQMLLHQIVRMRRAGPTAQAADSVPVELRPYLGKYLLAQVQAEFTVTWSDGRLAVFDPVAKRTIRLKDPDSAGRRLDEFGKNTIWFDREGQGGIEWLVIDSVSRFVRD